MAVNHTPEESADVATKLPTGTEGVYRLLVSPNAEDDKRITQTVRSVLKERLSDEKFQLVNAVIDENS